MPSKRNIARSIDDLDTDGETVEEWADRKQGITNPHTRPDMNQAEVSIQ
jgi:hypothetical protein